MQHAHGPRRPNSKPVVSLVALLIVAAGLRCGTIVARWPRLSADPDAYRLIAENLVNRGVFSRSPASEPARPTAFRPPLYPLLLAITARHGRVTPATVAAMHVSAGALTALLVWWLGRWWGLGRRASYLAALWVAADPLLLNQSSEVMTETIATLLCVAGLLALTQWTRRPTLLWAMLAGAVLGLAVLCRPTFLIWAACCGVYMIATERTWKRTAHAALFVAALAAGLLPWGLRNQHTFGRCIVTTTHGGYTLLLANNPPFYEYLRSGSWGQIWDARELEPLVNAQAGSPPAAPGGDWSELDADQRLYALAQQTIKDQPQMFLYASLVRVGYLWSPLAHRVDPQESRWQTAMRWGAAAWYVGLFVLAVVGAVRLRSALLKTPWVWGTLCVLTLILVHAVYWTNMRMRAPVMPLVALAAVAARRREPGVGEVGQTRPGESVHA